MMGDLKELNDIELGVEIVARLQEEVATQREVICNLNVINDELQAKLDRIKQIVSNYDGSAPSMIKQFSEIQKVLGKE